MPEPNKDLSFSSLETNSLRREEMIGSSTPTCDKPVITFPQTLKHSLSSVGTEAALAIESDNYFPIEMHDSVVSSKEMHPAASTEGKYSVVSKGKDLAVSIEGKDSGFSLKWKDSAALIKVKDSSICCVVENSTTTPSVKRYVANTSKAIKSSKKFHSLIVYLKGKGNSSRISPTTLFSSGDTSHFYSQPYNDSESLDN